MARVDRDITYINADGFSVKFGEDALNPFLLVDAEGAYFANNNVTISNNTMTDGGAYQGSVAKVRNIVLTLRDKDDHVYNRNLINALFKAKQQGTLIFREETNERKISCHVESVNSTGESGSRTYTVSLLCPDPFFYAMNDVVVYLASWVGAFTFPHDFLESREEFGYRENRRIQDIVNEQAEDGIGLTITISAMGGVTNPSVVRVESNEYLRLGSESNPFEMVAGDVLTITTSDNDKHVYLTHDGVTSEVNQYITEDSVFIQLMRGDNNIGYAADVGVDLMTVRISYRLKYASA